MAFTNETRNYGLPDWIGPDKPTWLVDLNNAFETIDNQMKANETAAIQAKQIGESAMDTAGNAIEATHTNAAAISALTASLSETNAKVDGLLPSTVSYTTTGDITGFGSETIKAVFLPPNTAICQHYIYGTTIKKRSLIDVPTSSGLSGTTGVFKVFPGTLPLFGNRLDGSSVRHLYYTGLIDKTTGIEVLMSVNRGLDGYYYGVDEANYNKMTEDTYEVAALITYLNENNWPTT